MATQEQAFRFALDKTPMGFDHFIDVYGPWGFGVAAAIAIMFVFTVGVVYIYKHAVGPFLRDMKELAEHHAEAQASLAVTAQTLNETMRESRTHIDGLKISLAEHRELLRQQRDANEKRRIEPDRNVQ